MHIFCRETEAHLEVHPHLPAEDKSGGGLITPDLWLKNCKTTNDSRSPSPSTSPKPPPAPPLPLITIAPPSKLMAIDTDDKRHNRNKIQRKHRKRQTTKTDDLPQDLRIRPLPSNEPSASRERLIEGRVKHTINNHVYNNPNNPRFYQPPRPTQYGLIKNPDLPPVTVLVPYPIVVPFPVPIPIPIPLGANFLTKQKSTCEEIVDEDRIEVVPAKVEEENPCEDEVDEVKNDVRPLRKRKRLLDDKSRILNKKKTLAV